jgi:hypothetical protein
VDNRGVREWRRIEEKNDNDEVVSIQDVAGKRRWIEAQDLVRYGNSDEVRNLL